jgi:hypothetical protein
MKALIPIPTGQVINEKVMEGLKKQSIRTEPIICAAEGVINSQRNYSPERIVGETRSRKKTQKEAKKITDPYVLLLDRDVVLTDRNAIKDMKNFMDKNTDVNAVALYFGRFPKVTTKLRHVVIRCVLIRRKVFVGMDLTMTEKNDCFCNVIKRGCKEKIEYLDFKCRTFELK